jgi:hypothetical protein
MRPTLLLRAFLALVAACGIAISSPGWAQFGAPGLQNNGVLYNVMTFGAKCDGTTDDTTAINNTIAAVSTIGGGTIQIPTATCLMTGAMVIPYTGTSLPTQKPLRITGSGASVEGYWNGVLTGGARLDMRYAGSASQIAKIDTRGAGQLEIDHLTLMDGATDNYLFINTSNTILSIHDVTFVGNQACTGVNCAQNAIQLGSASGSATTYLGTNNALAGFQGYGTNISNNYFEYIAIAVGFGGSANAVYLANNTISATSGGVAPYYMYGNALGQGGNIFMGGIIEMTHYQYGVYMAAGFVNENFFSGLGMYDETAGTKLGAFYFGAGADYNEIIPGYISPGMRSVMMTGPDAGNNLLVSSYQGNPSILSNGLVVGKNSGQTIQKVLGGGTASGDGAAVYLYNNGSFTGAIGNYSSISGGAYDNTLALYTTSGKIYMNANLGLGTVAPAYRLDLGTGTGSEFIRINGGNTSAGNGGGLLFRGGSIGDQSAITGSAYTGSLIYQTGVQHRLYIGGADIFDVSSTGASVAGTLNATTAVQIAGVALLPNFSATSASIGGGALAAGACASTTTTVTGARVGMVAKNTPATYPGDAFTPTAIITANDTVVSRICAIIAGTPAASTYAIRVIQ